MSCLFEFTQNFMHLNLLQALKVVIFTFYESKLKKNMRVLELQKILITRSQKS